MPKKSGLRQTEPSLTPKNLKRCSLDKVAHGRDAMVLELRGDRCAEQQLVYRGIRPGEMLRVRQIAPLGGPIMVEVNGGSVAIGRALARHIVVGVVPLP